MSGIPGSGKSTWAREHQRHIDTYISRDVQRANLRAAYHTDKYFPCSPRKEREYWRNMIAIILRDETSGDVWLDQTTIGTNALIRVIQDFNSARHIAYPDGGYNWKFHVHVIQTPLKTCLERNAQRAGYERVPNDVIYRMASRVEEFDVEHIREAFTGIDLTITYEGVK